MQRNWYLFFAASVSVDTASKKNLYQLRSAIICIILFIISYNALFKTSYLTGKNDDSDRYPLFSTLWYAVDYRLYIFS